MRRCRLDPHAAVPRAHRSSALFRQRFRKDLNELVDFFDRRFKIGLTDKEKQDLVNFLSIL
jgi:hypothetical protein